jgi:hypothetical protein
MIQSVVSTFSIAVFAFTAPRCRIVKELDYILHVGVRDLLAASFKLRPVDKTFANVLSFEQPYSRNV